MLTRTGAEVLGLGLYRKPIHSPPGDGRTLHWHSGEFVDQTRSHAWHSRRAKDRISLHIIIASFHGHTSPESGKWKEVQYVKTLANKIHVTEIC